jgi:uncharacterized membrane protein YraQ (UPF0718 family)/copper chaperone CopZ
MLLNIASEVWSTLCEMSPYLLFGFSVAGLLSLFISPETVERHLGGSGLGPVVKASLFGVPLPLCSCGVIPVAASLRRHGAGRGAAASFLLSTPQTGADSILVTLSLLGPVFAVFRPLAAFVTGLLGGSMVEFCGAGPGNSDADGDPCTDECCAAPEGANRLVLAARYAFVTLPGDIGGHMLVGLVLAGVIGAFVPHDFFSSAFGTGVVAMLVMMAVSIPVYVCATASVPIAAVMIAKGVSPGAALVFLMTGPATNAAAVAAVAKLLGKRSMLVYLGSLVVSALACGILLDSLFRATGTVAAPFGHEGLPAWVKGAAAIVLLAVLLHAIIAGRRGREDGGGGRAAPAGSHVIRLAVEGMTCSHCAETVRRALSECPGVSSAVVDRNAGTATVGGEGCSEAALVAAVERVGYAARGLSSDG